MTWSGAVIVVQEWTVRRMPNWCEGVLKIRGNFNDVKNFLIEGITCVNLFGKETKDCYKIEENTEEILSLRYLDIPYIKNTRRAFLLDKEIELWCGKKTGTFALNFRQAWNVEAEQFAEISKKYNIDIKINAYEKNMEFERRVLIEKGKIIENEDIQYDDYVWECDMPNLGG